MASIYSRKNTNGKIIYYASIYIDGKRHRKYLSSDKKTAEHALKKFEYGLLFNQNDERKWQMAGGELNNKKKGRKYKKCSRYL